MMLSMVKPGMDLERRVVVSEGDSITFLGADVKPSLSTPAMIAKMETTAHDVVQSHLMDGQDTVGIRVNVEHLAATPLGGEVTYKAKLVEVDGRRLLFEVRASDKREEVGRGTHERFIIDVDRFAAGVKKKFGYW